MVMEFKLNRSIVGAVVHEENNSIDWMHGIMRLNITIPLERRFVDISGLCIRLYAKGNDLYYDTDNMFF